MTWHHEHDRRLHYSDHSHRWIAPPDVTQETWSAILHAHMQAHLQSMGGPEAKERDAEVCVMPTRAERRAASWAARRLAG